MLFFFFKKKKKETEKYQKYPKSVLLLVTKGDRNKF